MGSFLLLGFVVGMIHALEADHLAAAAAMAARDPASRRNMTLRGMAWGMGHGITLLVVCFLVLIFGFALTDERAALLEFVVGVMLILLGGDVLIRMRRRRIHFHMHRHGDGPLHAHVHSHEGADAAHEHDPHMHGHASGFSVRALTVGLVHGAAGSAGLLTLSMAATKEPIIALTYVALFGLGAMFGMGILSFVVSWPLDFVARCAGRQIYRALAVAAGIVAMAIGVSLMLASGAMAWEAI